MISNILYSYTRPAMRRVLETRWRSKRLTLFHLGTLVIVGIAGMYGSVLSSVLGQRIGGVCYSIDLGSFGASTWSLSGPLTPYRRGHRVRSRG
jgi:hypothetical protein